MPVRILVAEDDRLQADVIRRYLELEGHQTTVVHDGRAALVQVRRREPDLVVLDLRLPSMDGVEVCRALRTATVTGRDVPVIMLTARSSEDDLLLGLSVGADDYLTKPYRPRELVARVQALLRRTARAERATQERFQVGGLVVDITRHEVSVDGSLINTTPAEFELLACLAAAPGRAFTREMLLERIVGFDREVTGRTIDTHVSNLRRKLEPHPPRPAYLLTVYGVGYKLADLRGEDGMNEESAGVAFA